MPDSSFNFHLFGNMEFKMKKKIITIEVEVDDETIDERILFYSKLYCKENFAKGCDAKIKIEDAK